MGSEGLVLGVKGSYILRRESEIRQCVSISIYNPTIRCTAVHLNISSNVLLEMHLSTAVPASITFVCVDEGLVKLIIETQADC